MNRQHGGRKLAAESLETRALMAGNIAASVQGGLLILRGDEAANSVVIQAGTNGALQVTGAATTINGGASFSATGVTRGVSVILGDGADSVTFGDSAQVTFPGAVVVDTGAGNDRISGQLKNTGAVTFNTGTQADTVVLTNSQLGTLVINTDPLLARDSGADRVTLSGVQASRAAVIRTGAGNDVVDITNGSFPLSLTVSTDAGNDRTTIRGTTTPLAVGGALTVNSGRGNDVVQTSNVRVNGPATFVNLDGSSQVTLNRLTATDGIYASLGMGDDDLIITDSSASLAVLIGGFGSNDLVENGNSFGEKVVVGF